jgi:uncharacterized protein with NAD-binding domain and iron-sulfur cluster
MAEKSTTHTLVTSGVVISLITSLSSLGEAYLQAKSASTDMKDSYVVTSQAINDLQSRMGRMEGKTETYDALLLRGARTANRGRGTDEEAVVEGRRADVAVAPALPVEHVVAPDAGVAGSPAAVKPVKALLPTSLEEALAKFRDSK